MTPFVKLLTKVLGVVLLLAGIAGFFMGGNLFGFEVDTMHNLVHIVSGVIGLAASGSYRNSRLFLIVFGVVYGAVALLGYATGGVLGLFSVNMADNHLHAVIAAACLLTGFGSSSNG